MTILYHRYRLDDGRYWGDTDTLNDDPECGYTDIDTPDYDPMMVIAVWNGTAWVLYDYSTGELGPPLPTE